MSRRRWQAWGIVAIICGTAWTGCSGKSDHGTVAGNVSLDGQLLKSGTIRFDPSDGQTAGPQAEIADGKFSVTMPLGDKRVLISSPKVVGQRKAYEGVPDSPTVPITQESLPARYNLKTELKYTVTAGQQTKDFELKSK